MQRCSAASDFVQIVQDAEPNPASVIYAPVFPHNDNTTIVGINAIIFNWDDILETGSVFNDNPVECVVETTSNVRKHLF